MPHRSSSALVVWVVWLLGPSLACSDRESQLSATVPGSGGEHARSATGICCVTPIGGASGAQGGSAGVGTGGTGETSSGGAVGLGGAAGDDGGGSGGGSGGGPVGCTSDSECVAQGACVRAVCDAGQCVTSVAKDGTACDDDNVCTDADRCVAGVCSGEPRSSEPAVLGWQPLFGGLRHEDPNGLQGLVEVLDGEHVVFLERMNQGAGQSMLVLGRLSISGIELLDYAFSPLRLHTQAVVGGGLDWTNRLFGHIVPLGGSRFAFVAAQAGIEVYAIDGSRLVLLSRTELPKTAGLLSGAAASQGRLFTCKPLVQSFAIGDDGSLGAEESVNVSCDTLASAPSADRLFVSDSLHGLSVLDTSNGAPVITQQNEAIGQLESLSAGVDYVGGVELRPAGAAGSVVVVRADDLSLVGRLEPTDDAWPTGVAFGDNDLFVQWRRGGASDCELSVARYTVDGGLTLERSQRVRGVSCRDLARRTTSPVRVSLAGQWLALQPFRDVLHVAQDGLTPITGPWHGAAERLLPVGSGLFDAIGPDSAHRIDPSNPAQPVPVAGGRVFDQPLEALRVLVSPGVTELMNVRSLNTPIEQQVASIALTRLVSEGAIPPKVSGRLLLDGGPSQLAFAGGYLFQFSELDATSFRVRRFGPASGLRGSGDTELVPELDAVLSFEPPSDLPVRVSAKVFPASEGQSIVMLEQRESAGGGERQPRLGLFELGQGKPVLVAQGKLTRAPALAAGAGSKLLVVGYDAVQVLEVGAGSFQVVAEWLFPSGTTVERILSWDGARARLATWTWAGDELTAGVLVLSGSELSELAHYDTHDEVLSLSTQAQNLAFAMKNGIAIASPACP